MADDDLFQDENRVGEARRGAKAVAAGHDASGHRARLRKRLLDGGVDAVADHEVVEYLLMSAIPRRDTKPLARALIKRFGSLAGVLNAETRALVLHPGMGETSAAMLKIVAVAAQESCLKMATRLKTIPSTVISAGGSSLPRARNSGGRLQVGPRSRRGRCVRAPR